MVLDALSETLSWTFIPLLRGILPLNGLKSHILWQFPSPYLGTMISQLLSPIWVCFPDSEVGQLQNCPVSLPFIRSLSPSVFFSFSRRHSLKRQSPVPTHLRPASLSTAAAWSFDLVCLLDCLSPEAVTSTTGFYSSFPTVLWECFEDNWPAWEFSLLIFLSSHIFALSYISYKQRYRTAHSEYSFI